MELHINEDIFAAVPTNGVLVIPVNCLGAMGKGLAEVAAKRWLPLQSFYKRLCTERRILPGTVTHFCGHAARPCVELAATKDDWRHGSDITWIEDIVWTLHLLYRNNQRPLYIPALGCGEGGLSWAAVYTLMLKELGDLSHVHVFAPHGWTP